MSDDDYKVDPALTVLLVPGPLTEAQHEALDAALAVARPGWRVLGRHKSGGPYAISSDKGSLILAAAYLRRERIPHSFERTLNWRP